MFKLFIFELRQIRGHFLRYSVVDLAPLLATLLVDLPVSRLACSTAVGRVAALGALEQLAFLLRRDTAVRARLLRAPLLLRRRFRGRRVSEGVDSDALERRRRVGDDQRRRYVAFFADAGRA